jgi:hypothetical protein
MSRRPRRHGPRLVTAVAAACLVGLATSATGPSTELAVAAQSGSRLSEAACFSAKGHLSWTEAATPSQGPGAPIVLQVTVMCAGDPGAAPLTPVTGLPVTLAVSPPGVVSLRSPARTATDAGGEVTALLVGVRPGTAHVLFEVADGGVCARAFSPPACRTTVAVVVPTHGAAPAPTPLTQPAPAKADGVLPPRNPARNAPFLVQIPPLGPCGSAGRYDASAACAQFYVAHINAARKLLGEHVTPMRLPTNWARLTPDEQLFVTADLERIDRNLPPYVGLSRTLDAVAAAGAARAEDPSPIGLSVRSAGGNEFPGVVSAAEADYGWMYSDGVGGNADCHAPTDPLCWGHRDNILGRYTGLGCTDCVMGAGIGSPPAESPDLTELFVAPTHPGEFPTYFTWAKDVVPYLKG